MEEEVMRRHYERTPKDILIDLLVESRKQVEKLQIKNKELKLELNKLKGE